MRRNAISWRRWLVPKCIDRRNLLNAAELLGEEGPPLIALVESPAALSHLDGIARAPRVASLMFGSEGYAAELGMPADFPAINFAAALVAAATTAAGLLAIGLPGSVANFSDLDTLANTAARARGLGFRAAAAIHPAQLAVLRDAVRPSAEEVHHAGKGATACEPSRAGGGQTEDRLTQ